MIWNAMKQIIKMDIIMIAGRLVVAGEQILSEVSPGDEKGGGGSEMGWCCMMVSDEEMEWVMDFHTTWQRQGNCL
jgi:hypothetical protein